MTMDKRGAKFLKRPTREDAERAENALIELQILAHRYVAPGRASDAMVAAFGVVMGFSDALCFAASSHDVADERPVPAHVCAGEVGL
jgi:hypothetical protein